MDGIIALNHFCESHGPCIILCTQGLQDEPQQSPHSLTVPWCESCQSIDLDQAFVSKDEKKFYVTTRTPLQQDLAFLLKQATVRTLSCEEETCKDGGTLYFGDNERGHVISHSFSLQDSLARGFHRKYGILVLMRDKIHLLNSWPSLTTHMKQIALDLQAKSASVNGAEQSKCSQRVLRQVQGSPGNQARSLSQLTGEPAIFSHLHMWFTWLLSTKNITEKVKKNPQLPISCSSCKTLKVLATEMDRYVFRSVCYCILTGISIEIENSEILAAFRDLLPNIWTSRSMSRLAKLYKTNDNKWQIEWSGNLPSKLPTLQILVEEALRNDALPENALESYLISIILQWYNIAKSLSWTKNPDPSLFQVLGIQKCDLPMLAYWTSFCK